MTPDLIHQLIAEAEAWRNSHRRAGRRIEATACSIRIRALHDVLAFLDRCA